MCVCIYIYIYINKSLTLCQTQRFLFLHVLGQNLLFSCHFDKRYTNSCEVLSHSGFDLHCLMINDTEKLCVYLLSSWGKEGYLGTWPICKLDYLVFF